MPAALGPLIGFALGVLLAWLGGKGPDPAEERGPIPRRAAIVALFGALVFAPVNAYFLAFAPDWSFAYLVDGRSVPSALGLLLVVLDAAAVVAGFTLAARRARARAYGAFIALGAVPGGLALLTIAILQNRLRVDASFHQFRSDFGTEPLAGGPLGYAVLWMNAIVVAGLVITSRALAAPRPRVGRGSAPRTDPAPATIDPGKRVPRLGVERKGSRGRSP